jgi:DNA replication protein DnaC
MNTEPTTTEDAYLDLQLARNRENARKATVARQVWLAELPASIECQRHPGQMLPRDDAHSFLHQAAFLECPLCAEESRMQREAWRLQRMGVPVILSTATFENWKTADEQATANLARVKEFTQAKRGFLILLGHRGTGKSHLAAAVLRSFDSGLFITQSELLRRLRQSYRDRAASDPIDEAQRAGCLVLDDVGLSAGGKDEPQLLHDVLDFRHGNLRPTVITANLQLDGLKAVIGERMFDRLRESAFDILNFGGKSYRPEARTGYFDLKMSAPPVEEDNYWKTAI